MLHQFFSAIEAEKDAAPVLPRTSHTAAARHRKTPAPWWWIAAGSAAATLLFGIIIYVATNKGTIKIEVNDPSVAVRVDGETVTIESLREPMTFRVGEHKLEIKRGDEVVRTQAFSVHRGENSVLELTLVATPPAQKTDETDEQVVSTEPPKPPTISGTSAEPAVEIRRFEGHRGQVTSAVFSRDGRHALSGSYDKTVRYWDVETGQVLKTFTGHTDLVYSVALSPDERFALSCGRDKTARLWDVQSGTEIHQFKEESWLYHVAFSPDGRFAAHVADHKKVRLWDVASHSELQVLEGHADVVRGIAFSHDGRRLVTCSKDKSIKLWNVADGSELRSIQTSDTWKVAFSPDDLKIVSSGAQKGDPTVRVWDTETGTELNCFKGHTDGVIGVDFSPDGRHILSGGYDATIRLWDTETNDEATRLDDHTGWVHSVAFSRDGRYALSGAADGMRLWRLPRPGEQAIGEIRRIGSHTGGLTRVAISRDGRRLLSGCSDRTVRLWYVESGQQLKLFTGHTDALYTVEMSPDGRYALSGGRDSTVILWDIASGEQVRKFNEGVWIAGVAFSPDSRRVANPTANDKVRVWEVETGKELLVLTGHTEKVGAVAFSPDGNRLLTGARDMTVRLWNANTGELIHTLTGHQATEPKLHFPIRCVAFSPDGRLAVSASDDMTVRLWDLEKGQQLHSFDGHEKGVGNAEFSPDGRFILSGSADGSIRLWDITTKEQLHRFDGLTGSVAARFTPDGRTVVSSGQDKTIRLWRLPEPKPLINSVGMKLVWIPNGDFEMGSTQEEIDRALRAAKDQADPTVRWELEHIPSEGPQHRVKITRPFYIGAYEVTVGQFRQFVTATGHKTVGEKDGKGGGGFNADKGTDDAGTQFTWQFVGRPQTDDHPVVNVAWEDAVAFCQWLSQKEGKQYRLPTEAEWEYACRAGTTTSYCFGDSLSSTQANFNGNFPEIEGKEPNLQRSTPVGSYGPNAFGLYDMHGNVWEWCADWYDKDYYSRAELVDPAGPQSGTNRVARGGSWRWDATNCRSANRSELEPTSCRDSVGFRVVCVVSPPKLTEEPATEEPANQGAESAAPTTSKTAAAKRPKSAKPEPPKAEPVVIRAPNLSRAPLLLNTNWATQKPGAFSHSEALERGFEDGLYFVRTFRRGTWGWTTAGSGFRDFACEVVGRVDRETDNCWAFLFAAKDGELVHGLSISVSGRGTCYVEPNFWESQKERGPNIGPIGHAAINKGHDFNSLLVVVHGRVVEVYVNNVLVHEPITVDRAITPVSAMTLGTIAREGAGLMEFKSHRVWSAENVPPVVPTASKPEMPAAKQSRAKN